MTNLTNGTVVTSIDNDIANHLLASEGYSIRYIETYHDHHDETAIVWDAPDLTETDLPY